MRVYKAVENVPEPDHQFGGDAERVASEKFSGKIGHEVKAEHSGHFVTLDTTRPLLIMKLERLRHVR